MPPDVAARFESAARESWMQGPIRLRDEPGNFSRAFREHHYDADLRQIGLEPNKQAYREKLASLGQSDPTLKKPNWLVRLFSSKPAPDMTRPVTRPKPCHGKGCNEPSKPQAATPVATTEYCWGYIDHCDRNGLCSAHYRPVPYSTCDAILRRLQAQEAQIKALESAMQAACAVDTHSANCSTASVDLQKSNVQVALLRKQYKSCLSAAAQGQSTGY